MKFYIQKASGERETFSVKKFRRSLKKAGASRQETEMVLREVMKRKPATMHDLHMLAINMLKKENRPIADRYNIKRGIMELGPEGFSFEQFMGELFRALGYRVKTDQIIPGACVDHQIDALLEKDGKQSIVEAKFHNRMGLKCDVKTTLYVQARFEDLRDYTKQSKNNFSEVWLVTNTKLTEQAMQYATCKGMRLIGWNYPAENNLVQLIEKYKLLPITTLSSLSSRKKQEL